MNTVETKITEILAKIPLLSAYKDQLLPFVKWTANKKFGDIQFNGCMKFGKNPMELASEIAKQISTHAMFANIVVAKPGFINIWLSDTFCQDFIKQSDVNGYNPWGKKHSAKVIVDYSSPNIAKEMHVGHLRSSIIGDTIANLHDFKGDQVDRINHIGDWGTQFGILIAYIFENNLNDVIVNYDLSKLMVLYQESSAKFKIDNDFKITARNFVVRLQNKEPELIKIWERLCHISQIGYDKIYQLLGINLIERGESFYQPWLQATIDLLNDKELVVESDGAKCVFLPSYPKVDDKILPLIVQKQDGGFNYATTDLAAIWHRSEVEQADKILYVTDLGQSLHFSMVFAAAKAAELVKKQECKHIGFGLVQKTDGKKFKTRDGDSVKLIDLIETAIERAKLTIEKRNPDLETEQKNKLAQILGINALKYSDLSCNRTQNYIFDFDKMLKFEGNTAAVLMYSYVRAISICNKLDLSPLKQNLDFNNHIEPNERELLIKLTEFNSALLRAYTELMPNRLCDYIYELASTFNRFCGNCQVIGSEREQIRLQLVIAFAKITKITFNILGMKTITYM